MAAAPALNYFVRGSEGLSLIVGPPLVEPKIKLDRIQCTAASFSTDGSILLITTSSDVTIYDADSAKQIMSLPLSGATATALSPKGTFLQTFQKPVGQQANLILWNLKTGEAVLQFSQKAMPKSDWPAIQISEDEIVACRMVTNEVHVYDGTDFAKGIIDRLHLPGIDGAKLAFDPSSHIAAYIPEAKGQPASARIYELSQVSQAQPVARRSFFKSSRAQLMWNRGSTGLLVLTHSDVDKTNQSYYGESKLHFLTVDSKHEGAVPLNKEGPIHDVQWSPNGKEFLVIYGFMPAKATLFDAMSKPLFDFGTGPYNTIRWNPQNQFLCLAGFGNLPGDMAFWDRTTLKRIGNTKAAISVTSEWSADGRYFMTATTAPRLQVDNGIKIFKYDGSLHFEKKYDKLYLAEWRPMPIDWFPERPPSPSVKKIQRKQEHQTVNVSKPVAYRPPNASNSAALKTLLFGEDEKVNSSGGLSKSALKNQKRRNKKEKEKQATNSEASDA